MSRLARDAVIALALIALGGLVTVVVKAWQQMRRDDLLIAAIAAGLPTVVKPSDTRLVALLRALREHWREPDRDVLVVVGVVESDAS